MLSDETSWYCTSAIINLSLYSTVLIPSSVLNSADQSVNLFLCTTAARFLLVWALAQSLASLIWTVIAAIAVTMRERTQCSRLETESKALKGLKIFLASTSLGKDICIFTTDKQQQQQQQQKKKKKKKKFMRLSSCDMKSRDGRAAE